MKLQNDRVTRMRTRAQAQAPIPDVQIIEPSCIHDCCYGEKWQSRDWLDKQTPQELRQALKLMLCYARNAEERNASLKSKMAEQRTVRADDIAHHRREQLEPEIEQNSSLVQEFPELAHEILQEVVARSNHVLNDGGHILAVTIDPSDIFAIAMRYAETMYHAGRHGEYQAGFNAGFRAGAANPQTHPGGLQPSTDRNATPPSAKSPRSTQEAPPTTTSTTTTRRTSTRKRRRPAAETADLPREDAPDDAEPGPSRPRKRVRTQASNANLVPPASCSQASEEETGGYAAMRKRDWETVRGMGLEVVKDGLVQACETHRRCQGEDRGMMGGGPDMEGLEGRH